MFKPNPLYETDGYKVGHIKMLAPGTTKLYGTWIPRSIKHAPKGIKKIVSFGHQLTWKEIHDIFTESFFGERKIKALQFTKDMSLYLGMEYNGKHFEELYDLGYLPILVKALPEGIETNPNIPHQTFINTIDGFAWLPLFLETIISNLAWESSTAATIVLQYKRNATKWVMKTDPNNAWLIQFLCHDFSARGLVGRWGKVSVGLGHASGFRGSDTLITIPAARYYYGEPENEVCINSVNASEHSVTCTGIFYYEAILRQMKKENNYENRLKKGKFENEIEEYYSYDIECEGSIEEPDYKAIAEWMNLRDWLKRFPKGILSIVSDTFDLWKLIIYILPRLKEEIMSRDGKLVIRPDSGDPVDIICGENSNPYVDMEDEVNTPKGKGVIKLLWDIFGGTISAQGYKVLDPHIGSIYGDSITLDRQIQIYERLANKGFASTNIILGVGSFTYQFNTRDTLGSAAKGAWFETKTPLLISENYNEYPISEIKQYNIYKDPITDSGTKKSLKGLCAVFQDENKEYYVKIECTPEEEKTGILQIIYKDGKFYNQTSLTEIRKRIDSLVGIC